MKQMEGEILGGGKDETVIWENLSTRKQGFPVSIEIQVTCELVVV